ncbi:MAG: sensor histidine kinase [Bryobacterales bacterium]|nr:sensor histidine kinase [Bryobacterales bacterium]
MVTDSELDERTAQVRDSYRLTLIRSVIFVPLLKEGRSVAAMAVHDATPRQWKQHEVELVQRVAGRCWESIERARVSRQLHEREQRYRFLAESIPQMVWTAAPDGKLDYVNEQVTSYFGTTSGSVLGQGWLEWVHPEDRLNIVERWKHSLETGERYETAFRLLRSSDSSWRWHLVRATAMLSLHGETARWFGTCTDFEDQKQAEIERRRTQELLQMVIDRVPGLVSYFDSDLRYAFTNSHYSEWFGAGPFVGRKVSDVVGEEAFARAWPYMERAFAGEEVRFEEFLPYHSSKPRYVQVSFSPHRTQHGTVNGVVATVQDITAQKTMEEALRRSEERLQQVFRQAPVAIIVLRGKDLVAELVNPFYQNLLQGRELIGRRFADVVPEIGSDVLQASHHVMETGDPYVRDEFYIPYDQNGDGANEDHWFNLVYHPLREPDGSVSGVVTVCNEVTVQVRARQELERLNRELEEFAYVASHDLQEPLRMVNIYTQLLLRRHGGDTPQAREYASIIHTGVNRMEALIHDLLTFSRIIHSEESPASLVDLSAAVAEATSVLRDRIEESRASIAAQQLPTVPGDTAQIAQVFQNLLSNAMKYQQSGTRPEIRITAECDDVNWTIAIKDNGIGFEPRYAERIFGLFRRLHKDEYPGTGLGLAICRRIVERHKGKIWAESTPGNGSTFYLALPCRKEKT